MLPHKYGFRRLEHVHLPPGQADVPEVLRALFSLWLMTTGLAIIGVSTLGYLFGGTLPEQLVSAPEWFQPLAAQGLSPLQLITACGALWLATGLAIRHEKTALAVGMGLVALTGSILISL